jgi:hypothetical protein
MHYHILYDEIGFTPFDMQGPGAFTPLCKYYVEVPKLFAQLLICDWPIALSLLNYNF